MPATSITSADRYFPTMMHTGLRICLAAVAACVISTAYGDDAAAGKVEFNRDIRPILSDRCFSCHGPDAHDRKADLRLDTTAGALADLGGRQAIVPDSPEDSELFLRITSTDDSERMPPPRSGEPLTVEQIDLFKRWIEQGAEYQAHWSFIAPKRPEVPTVKQSDWPRNDVDRFVLTRLEQEGIAPSAEADRITLIRRAYFDLTGLPPTPADVQSFLDDTDPRAYEKQIDRLLQSPHFGERMAMYWLDLVRYADTVGYHGDQEHRISPYRDYVIKAFRDNMPFDRFTIEQLAGDLLPDVTEEQIIASGYNRVLQTSHEGGVQIKEYLHKYDADRIRNLGSVWMAATLGCVECHDHKFDPYSQRDYYSLAAFFADLDDTLTLKRGTDSNPTLREPEREVLSPFNREKIAALEAKMQQLVAALPSREGPAEDATADSGSTEKADPADCEPTQQIAALQSEIDALKQQKLKTLVSVSAAPKTVRILGRGDWMDETGQVVEPAVPAFLKPLEVNGRRPTRLDLARWLVSPDHPQTARVFVNRLWYLFFGNGLCNSLEDAGSQGEWPSHPELLDWLAVEFAQPTESGILSSSPPLQGGAGGVASVGRGASESGGATPPNLPLLRGGKNNSWDVKHIARLLVTSAAYRQASAERADLRVRDPNNRLYARQSAFRLPAEMIRDQALAVSGLLVDRLGGPSARPYQPARYYKFLNFPKRDYEADLDDNQYRRGVYVHWQRTYLHPMLRAFDAPSREECTARRPISNTPLSALVLLNDPTFVEAARVFAAKTIREGGADDHQRLDWAWSTVLLRTATADEHRALLQLLRENRAAYEAAPDEAAKLVSIGNAQTPADIPAAELSAWTAVARALLNLHETITRY